MNGGGAGSGGSSAYPGWVGYIEIDDETGEAIGVDYSGLELTELPENLKFMYRGYKGDWTSGIGKITNTYKMFSGCTNLTSFGSDLSALTNGNSMFYGCSKMTSFSSDLPSLTEGNSMFSGCKLDVVSVEKILTTIPTYIDGSSHTLTMSVQKGEAVNKFNEITGSTGDSGTYNYKGWTINLSSVEV